MLVETKKVSSRDPSGLPVCLGGREEERLTQERWPGWDLMGQEAFSLVKRRRDRSSRQGHSLCGGLEATVVQ